MSKVTEIVESLAKPLVLAEGLLLWDVEYVKEAGQYFLRVYIDKETPVSIEDCERVSHALSDLLDEADPIRDSYTFEVSSAGADRVLRKAAHFESCLGSLVDVRLYEPYEGSKTLCATLLSVEADGSIQLAHESGRISFPKSALSQVRLHVSF